MRLDWLKLRNFKNLTSIDINFDEGQLFTALVGENGAGKSNVIEAIATIFRDLDLNQQTPFPYAVAYTCRGRRIEIDNRIGGGAFAAKVDGFALSRSAFHAERDKYLPSNVFGYYSGGSRRLEEIFDPHQVKYYKRVISPESVASDVGDVGLRRLFYSRQSYGQLALLSYFAFGEKSASEFLRENMSIAGFDCALIILRRPRWAGNQPSKHQREHGDPRFWYSAGLVRGILDSLWNHALAPISGEGREQEDYRTRPASEEQVYIFIKDADDLRELAEPFGDEKTFFSLLETLDISDLIREVRIWVKLEGAEPEVPFHEISDGEKQLLSVLGLMRFAGRDESLYLLDEPDTHLNPAWKWGYLQLVKRVAQQSGESHIVMTSHDPLTLGGLLASQVQVMSVSDDGNVTVSPPDLNPRGLGFTSILTQIFGLETTLDPETQRLLDERNAILSAQGLEGGEDSRLVELSTELRASGFILEDREPEYELFLRARAANQQRGPQKSLSPDEIKQRNEVAKRLLEDLTLRDKQA